MLAIKGNAPGGIADHSISPGLGRTRRDCPAKIKGEGIPPGSHLKHQQQFLLLLKRKGPKPKKTPVSVLAQDVLSALLFPTTSQLSVVSDYLPRRARHRAE